MMTDSASYLFSRILICFLAFNSVNNRISADETDTTDFHKYFTTQPYPDELNTLENIPKIPDGHRHFQFYTLDPNGNLLKQWMSLQEVQHIILAHAYQNHPKYKVSLHKRPPYNSIVAAQKNDAFFQNLIWKVPENRPETSVEDVLANVQKVMSKEITKTYLNGDFPTSPTTSDDQPVTASTFSDLDGVTAQNITIPDTILGHLMREQVASLESHNPWGILTTPTVGEKFNTALERFKAKLSGTEATEPSGDEESIIEENFVESNDGKTTNNLNLNTQTETNFFNDTESLLRLNPGIFDSTTGVPDDLYSTVRTTGIITETTNTNRFGIQTAKKNYENEYKIFENQKNTAKVDNTYSTNTPFETWATSNIIYTKDKPSYTLIPVTDLGNFKNTEDLTFIYKNTDEYPHQTTKGINNEVDVFESVTTTSFPPSMTEFFQNTAAPAAESTSEEPTTTTQYGKLAESSIPLEESLNEIAKDIYSNQIVGNKFIENSKFSTVEIENPQKETVNKFKDGLGSDIPNRFHYDDRPVVFTNVLTPSEIAKGSSAIVGNLGVSHGKNEYNFSYYDTNIYLEDIPEVDYDFVDTSGIANLTQKVNKTTITFPRPNVTDSYHKPDHINHNIDSKGQATAHKDTASSLDPDYPLQFLPAYNPAIAQRENPLKNTPLGNLGLEATVLDLDPNIREYVDSMNDIAFKVYKKAAEVHRRQNMVMAPINLISALSMLHLTARDTTADALSKLLKFDDLLTFNPHLILKNVTESLIALNSANHEAALVNNLFIEKSNKKSLSLDYFDRTLDFFYKAKINEVPESTIGPRARDQANEVIRAQTLGVVPNFLKPNASLKVVGPLSVVSSAYFQGDWGIGINEKDLIDMSFIRFPSAERRLIKTVGLMRRMNINAGYSQELDATVTEVPLDGASKEVSLILVMPGQQKSFVANGLSQLEQSLTSEGWTKLLRAVLPHTINFKMPIFSHRNYLNLSGILSIMGLKELFSPSADFTGINGLRNLHLGDVVQLSEFHSCKLAMQSFSSLDGRSDDTTSNWSERAGKSKYVDETENTRWNYLKNASDYIKKRRHEETKKKEVSPKNSIRARERRQNDRLSNFYRNDDTLAYDRAFFYVLRHNPTGLILFIGRYLDPETF